MLWSGSKLDHNGLDVTRILVDLKLTSSCLFLLSLSFPPPFSPIDKFLVTDCEYLSCLMTENLLLKSAKSLDPGLKLSSGFVKPSVMHER